MKSIMAVATFATLGLFCAACSSGGASSGHTVTVTAQASSAAAAAKAASSSSSKPSTTSKLTYAMPASVITEALGCTNPAPKPSDTDTSSVSLPAPKPSSDTICTFQGQQIEVAVWPSAPTQAAADALIQGYASSFGFEAYLAEGEGWQASLLVSDASKGDPASEQTVGTGIVARIGGTLKHYA